MQTTRVRVDELSALRTIHSIIQSSDDDDVDNLDGNIRSIMEELDRIQSEPPVDQIERVRSFGDIYPAIGLISEEDRQVLSRACLILSHRRVRLFDAISSNDGGVPSHENGEIWRVLMDKLSTVTISINTINTIMHEWVMIHAKTL